VTLIEGARPDYLKWDNNFWINCDRDGHGHGTRDGNFTHVNGLYTVLADLRLRYPNLLVENVSGGGNRMDFGMLRYTDVAWMDDRTGPSLHVRHNVEGLSAVFPPAYLLSFLVDDDSEPLHNAPDMRLYARSRMVGAFGVCVLLRELNEGDAATLAHEVDIYKALRDTHGRSAGVLLTPQARSPESASWDALQEAAEDHQRVVISVFLSESAGAAVTVRPVGLSPTVVYEVQSVDAGLLGTATGLQLMTDGVQVIESPVSAAHILILTAK
jgi:alpha-galactosidase